MCFYKHSFHALLQLVNPHTVTIRILNFMFESKTVNVHGKCSTKQIGNSKMVVCSTQSYDKI